MWWSWELLMGLAGTLGAINLAAHASLTSMVSLYWSWIGCTSMTSCVRVGNHLGAGDADSARCAAKVPVIFLAVILLVVWIACMTMRDSFAFLYTADPQVAAAAASVLPLYLFSQSCAACSFGFKGCLDGCGADNRFFQFVCDRLSRACLGTSSRFSYENSRKARFLSALQGSRWRSRATRWPAGISSVFRWRLRLCSTSTLGWLDSGRACASGMQPASRGWGCTAGAWISTLSRGTRWPTPRRVRNLGRST